MQNTEIKGQLEIDHERGVIYFHAADAQFVADHGVITVLRICNLPRPIPQIHERSLDITHMIGADWNGSIAIPYLKVKRTK